MKISLFPLPIKRPPLPPPAPDSGGEPTFIFAHVPKCGGKTFNSILKRNFPKTYYREESLYTFYPYTARDVDVILRYRPTLRAISSHRFTLDLPWTTSPRPIRALVFLRDPVERALSAYFFLCDKTHLEADAKHQTLEEFLRKNPSLCTNFQAQYLANRRLPLRHLAQLVRLGWSHLFPLERFDDALLALERAYPSAFRDCAYKILNVAPRTAELSPPSRARFQQTNTHDYQLLALAHQHLDSLLARFFPTPAELESARADLRLRCDAFRAAERP